MGKCGARGKKGCETYQHAAQDRDQRSGLDTKRRPCARICDAADVDGLALIEFARPCERDAHVPVESVPVKRSNQRVAVGLKEGSQVAGPFGGDLLEADDSTVGHLIFERRAHATESGIGLQILGRARGEMVSTAQGRAEHVVRRDTDLGRRRGRLCEDAPRGES